MSPAGSIATWEHTALQGNGLSSPFLLLLPLDEGSTLLAPVFCDVVLFYVELFKIFPSFTANRITLRTKTTVQLARGNDQMAVPAANFIAFLLHKGQCLVAAL